MKKTIQALFFVGIGLSFGISTVSAQNRSDRLVEMIKRIPIVIALDANGDGEISADEIEASVAALKKLDKNENGKLESSEMMPTRSRDRQRNGRQVRSDNAPKVGDTAPTFKLKSLDGRSETDLADFKGKKPVVLFFGSYT